MHGRKVVAKRRRVATKAKTAVNQGGARLTAAGCQKMVLLGEVRAPLELPYSNAQDGSYSLQGAESGLISGLPYLDKPSVTIGGCQRCQNGPEGLLGLLNRATWLRFAPDTIDKVLRLVSE